MKKSQWEKLCLRPHEPSPRRTAPTLKKSSELQNVAVSRQIVVSQRSPALRDRNHIDSSRGGRRFARFDRSLELLRLHERDSPRFPRDTPRSRIEPEDTPRAPNRYHSLVYLSERVYAERIAPKLENREE